ncbi:phosphate ABC transporter ATP-binding protein [Gelria sp. Kuro-4]|jgi:putative ABC transport system ATP-binding protein|uniref:ABC transporter ATP-binding protein n=1 Tax=Gelria sp. Kuro-4 TaxID=2796927 RepID=UPI001BEFAC79|nr:phosphate ABC transporter ATP-binding protein [Gelria sp. Kuro-4]MDI3523184.1 UDP-glucose/iron transport system ATP-binding protein [Bacillota bacterium]MDK2927595.1 UDP-glucose/iron transport system ATP-binding protein [Bacillota bacterium]BCV23425.1 phosphate ABC transporter ATP-binding protein [Gelria sp. Kuro-4]
MTDKLVLEQVSKEVGGQALLENISFAVPAGSILALIGPSGAGKSTLLSLLNRLEDPTGGSIRLDGVDIRALDVLVLRRRVGMVFQRPSLFPGTVAANITYGPALRGEKPAQAAEEYLKEVGLPPEFAARDAQNLSGGEEQRVALARALANGPEVLLLDEPTAALDKTAAHQVEELIARICRQRGLTALWVTHDLEQARRVSDRVVLIVGGCKVEEGATADFFLSPQTETGRAFLAGRLAENSGEVH